MLSVLCTHGKKLAVLALGFTVFGIFLALQWFPSFWTQWLDMPGNLGWLLAIIRGCAGFAADVSLRMSCLSFLDALKVRMHIHSSWISRRHWERYAAAILHSLYLDWPEKLSEINKEVL